MKNKQIRQELLQKQTELQHRVSAISRDLKQTRQKDFSELVVESENDEVLLGLHDEALVELEQIAKAIALLDADKYGVCLECGEIIAKERVQAIPYSTLCIACAEKNEKTN